MGTDITEVGWEKLVGRAGALGLHILAVYLCAIHISPWLISRWFAWLAPVLHATTSTPPGNWYLQHFELASAIPAAFLGFIAARRVDSVATWAWVGPVLILAYKMLVYRAPSSVLVGTLISAFTYFFDIQTSMPTMDNPTASDPVRALAQLMITAPFYAGVAYSAGAVVAKQNLHRKILGSRGASHEDKVRD
jgi:hypothetical protein